MMGWEFFLLLQLLENRKSVPAGPKPAPPQILDEFVEDALGRSFQRRCGKEHFKHLHLFTDGFGLHFRDVPGCG